MRDCPAGTIVATVAATALECAFAGPFGSGAPVASHLQTRVVCVRGLVCLILGVTVLAESGPRAQRGDVRRRANRTRAARIHLTGKCSHRSRARHLTGSSQSCGQTRRRRQERRSPDDSTPPNQLCTLAATAVCSILTTDCADHRNWEVPSRRHRALQVQAEEPLRIATFN